MTRIEKPALTSDAPIMLDAAFVAEQALMGLSLFVAPLVGVVAAMSVTTKAATLAQRRSAAAAIRAAARQAYRRAARARSPQD